MSYPIITPELTQRIERVWAQERADRIQGSIEHLGNPMGGAVERFGGAVACRAERLPRSLWLNRTMNLTGADVEHLDALFAFYREKGVVGQLEICPATTSPELLRGLAERGAYQVGFHTVTYGPPLAEEPALPQGVEVRTIREEEMDQFLRVYLEGFGDSLDLLPNFRYWYHLPGWHHYLAWVDGQPAGAAILVVADGLGYMAAAATQPACRGRGVQKALLHRRSAEAARAGCDLLFGQCAFGSISHANQGRAGLRTAYTKAIWATEISPI